MKTGDVLTGPLHLSILPQQNTELANKEYVDRQVAPLINELQLLKLNDKSLTKKLLKLDKKNKALEVDISKLHKKITEQSKIVILLSITLRGAIIKNTNQNKQLKEELVKVTEKNQKLLQQLQQLQSTFQKSVDELSTRITQQVKFMNKMINEVKTLNQKVSDKAQLNALKTALKINQEKMQVNSKEIKVHHTLLDAIDKVQHKINKVITKLLSIHTRKS